MFTFAKTSSSDFTIIKDGVDTSLEIIVHKATGFFNITKIAALVKKLKIEEQAKQAVGISTSSKQPGNIFPGCKDPRAWFKNDATKRLIASILRHNSGVDAIKYELAEGTPKRFAGTYLHETAYDHFMMWFDEEYAIRVSILLKSHRFAAQNDSNATIKRLSEQLTQNSAEMAELKSINLDQSDKIDKLLGYGKQAKKDCKEIKSELKKGREERREIIDHLEDQTEIVTTQTSYMESMHSMLDDRSRKSTKNPEQESLHHYFACTGYTAPDGKRVAKFISGQKDYVERKVAEYINKDVLPHELLLAPFYNANPIDLRNNSKTEFARRRAELITRLNVENKVADDTYNFEQKELIKIFNKSLQSQITKLRAKIRPGNKKRPASAEKISEHEADIQILDSQKMKPVLRKTPKIKVGDITIDFKRSLVIYANNPYITFDEVLKVVSDVNGSTQENPVPIAEELEEIKRRDPVPIYTLDNDSDDDSDAGVEVDE